MSEGEADGPGQRTQVSASGVTVIKAFNDAEFSVPVLFCRIACDRDEPVVVRIVDPLPESLPPDVLGFHPDYGEEHWEIEADEAIFEREIEPGEQYQTFYGIDPSDVDTPGARITEPELTVDPTDTGSDGESPTDTATDEPGASRADSSVDGDRAPSGEATGAVDTDGRDQSSGAESASRGIDFGSDVVQDALAASPDDVETISDGEDTPTAAATAGDGDDHSTGSGTADDAVASGTETGAESESGDVAPDRDPLAVACEEAIEMATEHIEQAREDHEDGSE